MFGVNRGSIIYFMTKIPQKIFLSCSMAVGTSYCSTVFPVTVQATPNEQEKTYFILCLYVN